MFHDASLGEARLNHSQDIVDRLVLGHMQNDALIGLCIKYPATKALPIGPEPAPLVLKHANVSSLVGFEYRGLERRGRLGHEDRPGLGGSRGVRYAMIHRGGCRGGLAGSL